jgi:amino acid adenylation domain-containing protein
MKREQLEGRRARLSEEQRTVLAKRLRGLSDRTDPIPAGRGNGPAPLSFAQERIWLFEAIAPGTAVYNQSIAVRLEGFVDARALEQALRYVVGRHEALRTVFEGAGGTPTQSILPNVCVDVPHIDLSSLPPAERLNRAQLILAEQARRPFDLARGPLFRFMIVRLDVSEHVVFLCMHHIVFDGSSLDILLADVALAYRAEIEGGIVCAPAMLRYVDFATWQRNKGDDDQELSLSFWKARVSDFPQQIELPRDLANSQRRSYSGGFIAVEIPAELFSAVRDVARRLQSTARAVLFAAFATLLLRQTGMRRFLVAVPVAGRGRRELEGIIGFFVNTLPFPIEIHRGAKFNEVVRGIDEVQSEISAHMEAPFEHIARAVGTGGDTALAQVMFAYQRSNIRTDALPGIRVTYDLVHAGGALFDLNLVVHDSGDALSAWLEYRSDRFYPATVERMGGHLLNLLEAGMSMPQRSIDHLPMLSGSEREIILERWNGTPAPPFRSLMSMIGLQATKFPNDPAVVDAQGTMSYDELLALAENGARSLIRGGVRAEQVVAIHARRSRWTIVAILAVLLAGGASLLIDETDPEERRRYLIEHSRATRVLDPDGAWVDELCSDGDPASYLAAPVPQQLVYLIYTSGSTGRPKGVGIEHGALSNVIRAHISAYALSPRMRVLQFYALSCDGTYTEIFSTLASGATLYFMPSEAIAPGQALLETLRSNRINHIGITPSALALLPRDPLADLQTIVAAGEACYQELVDRWAISHRVVNGYGPSEATIGATAGKCEPGERKPSIGRPLPGYRVYVLDASCELLPVGIPGELYVAGIGVARAYMGRPDLTAERFVADPFAQGERMVRTGDRACWLPDGRLEFLGRVDRKLKLRGFFVDPGEIESVLREHDGVAEASVLAHGERSDDQRLVAYFTAKGPASPSPRELREHCRRKLPRHLIPSAFAAVARMPLLPNGKLDQAQLKEMPVPANSAEIFIAPRTPQELRVALAFERVLDMPVGMHDDFFALGGHSLHVALLGAVLERETGRRLTLHDLLIAPTVEQLASRLDRSECAAPELPFVPMSDRLKEPLYLVHPIGGGVGCYAELARCLAPEISVIGLQADGLEGNLQPVDDVGRIAERYVCAIRDKGSPARYRLGGWSFGGIVALEMAHQLRAANEDIECLILLDANWGHAGEHVLLDDDRVAVGAILREAAMRAGINRVDGLEQVLAERSLDELLQSGLAWAERAGALPRGLGTEALRRRLAVLRAHLRALSAYQPRPYAGTTLFFEASESARSGKRLHEEWAAYSAASWRVEVVQGTHDSMLAGTGALHLAGRLRALLSSPLGASEAPR